MPSPILPPNCHVQSRSLAVGLVVDHYFGVFQEDGQGVYSAHPARFGQGSPLHVGLLVRITAQFEEVLQNSNVAEGGCDVNGRPLIFSRSVGKTSTFAHQELDHVKLFATGSIKQRCLPVRVFLVKIKVVQLFKEMHQVHVPLLHCNMCRCQLLIMRFTRSDSPRI